MWGAKLFISNVLHGYRDAIFNHTLHQQRQLVQRPEICTPASTPFTINDRGDLEILKLDKAVLWFLVIGVVFVVMAMGRSWLKKLPVTTSIMYLLAGFALGPYGLDLFQADALKHHRVLERITEVAVIISLFTAGLKLRVPLSDCLWRPPILLATAGMVLTVGLITLYGTAVLGLSLGAAVLLGAVLAPTDPVLASDVQTINPSDTDRVRFSLTGEAGLNDGTAFPFVMLGLGLLGAHELGNGGARWFGIDLIWATFAGLAVGTACGMVVARIVLYFRSHHKEAIGLDDFLALGLIALSYGAALAVHAYGFLAVFAAGLAMRREERRNSPGEQQDYSPHIHDESEEAAPEEQKTSIEEAATNPQKAPAYMAEAVLHFNEALERIAEVGVVVILGTMLSPRLLTVQSLTFTVVLFLLLRPIAALLCAPWMKLQAHQLRLVTWFGIRGIGSVYYLTYAFTHGADADPHARILADIVVTVIVSSILVHGFSVTPIMRRYTGHREPDVNPA